MAAAVIELDALPDAVRPAAEDHHAAFAGLFRRRFVFIFVGRIIIGRVGLELGRAGIDRLERGHDPPRFAMPAHVDLRGVPDHGQLPVGKAELLGPAERGVVDVVQAADAAQLLFHLHDLLQILQEPGIDAGQIVDFLDRHAVFHGVAQVPHALIAGHGQFRADFVDARLFGRAPQILAVAAEAETAHLQPAQGLLKGLLERPPDGHRLAHAFHLRGEFRIGLGKFFKGESRHLHHHVVDRRLETGHRLARDVVGQFVQAIADGQLGGDLGDGKARGLRGQGARAADARIHLDHDHPPGLGMDGELDVRPARIHADLADHGQRGVAHPLIFLVGQRLGRGHGDRIARVHAHGIEILDRADDDHVVVGVAHDLHFVFFPAEDRLLPTAPGGWAKDRGRAAPGSSNSSRL